MITNYGKLSTSSLKIISILILSLFWVLCYSQIEVRNVEDLMRVGENLEGRYIQTADIDLREIENWRPIGSDQNPFRGVYDGGGYKITNLNSDPPAGVFAGLFGLITGNGCEVKRVGLVNANISGERPVGGIVSFAADGAVVRECFFNGTLDGIAGVGPIVGNIAQATVVDCYATGEINALRDGGGVVGASNQGRIFSSYSTVYIEGPEENMGGVNGFLGDGEGVIASYWDMQATNCRRSNGGIGRSTDEMLIQRNYDPEPWDFERVWTIDEGETYPYLRWQREPADFNRPGLGGPSNLAAISGDRVVRLTWDAPPGEGWVGYNVYRNNERYRTLAANQNNFDDTEVQNYTQYEYYVKAIYEGQTESRATNTIKATPHESFAGGNGTEDSPYEIATARQLSDIRFDLSAHFIQVADINLDVPPWNQGQGWEPIGYYLHDLDCNVFDGTYDGNGFSINGMTIVNQELSFVGLFAYIRDTTITNVVLENASIVALNYIGCVAGRVLRGTIVNCSVSAEIEGENGNSGIVGYGNNLEMINCQFEGEVRGRTRNGCLVGDIYGTSRFFNCHASGTVVGGHQFAAGLVPYLTGNVTVDKCSFEGNVTGTVDCGGIAGWNTGLITNSYFKGRVTGNSYGVGGIAGQTQTNGKIKNCFVDGEIRGRNAIGGIVGMNGTTQVQPPPQVEVSNCYVRGSVIGTEENSDNLGGVAGSSRGPIINCYSTARVIGPAGGTSGLLHTRAGGEVTGCYWDIETSEQQTSNGGGLGRMTRQMIYPYDAQTYQNWDFEEIWSHDETGDRNDGYPFLSWQVVVVSPHPNIAQNPSPADRGNEIDTNLEEISWSYIESELFTNPVGFRVYFGTNADFDEEDFVWIEYVEERENYSTDDYFEEPLAYNTTYYWRVVPTTIDPNDGRAEDRNRKSQARQRFLNYRGDAQNAPTWRFTTGTNPHPKNAVNPIPANEAVEVPLSLESVGWKYFRDANYSDPVGFRVYLNTTGEFGEDDDFHWVPFRQNQSDYMSSDVLPEEIGYAETYYWKVVPTTDNPDERKSKTRKLEDRRSLKSLQTRTDAENVEVWSFSTITSNPNPLPATNPNPEHLAIDVSLSLDEVSWDYIDNQYYAKPSGFRVYMNETGQFGMNALFEWVEYQEDKVRYSCADILPLPLDVSTTYYWRVIPTTDEPDSRLFAGNDRDGMEDQMIRGDAEGVITWRFTTTSTTDIESQNPPLTTELHNNYPNPFNPETTVRFSLSEPGKVSLVTYNSKGQRVATLIDKELNVGNYSIKWDGKDYNGTCLGSGFYFVRMSVDGETISTKKMLMIK